MPERDRLQDPILGPLNEKQREAVTAVHGPVLIIAGAGSGKTKALTHRVAYLVSQGVKPENILAVTFTNKAADEMRNRIRALTNNQQLTTNNSLFVGTFHSFCASVLRAEYAKIGFRKNFTIFDDDDSLSLVKEVMRGLNVSSKQYQPGMMGHVISGLKNQLIGPEEYALEYSTDVFTKTVSRVYAEYQKKLKDANAFDFDDLIMQVVLLFRKSPDILEKYQNHYKYLHVDEFQDTNLPQYLLVRLLAKKHGNIFVIGDDGQAIYGWRGADWRNILNFEKDWPGARVIFLEQNYRSTKTILAAANHLIRHNALQKEKNLWTDNADGVRLTLNLVENERREAEAIAEEIVRLTKEENKRPEDVAVLYRTNAQSRALEEALIEYSLPYVIIGGIKFFQRKEIKDIVAYLRYLVNPSDYVSLRRIINLPPRGIGKVAFLNYVSGKKKLSSGKEALGIEKFDHLIDALRRESEKLTASKFIKALLQKIRYREYLDDGRELARERWENVQELVSLAAHFDELGQEGGITKLLEEIALVSFEDRGNPGERAQGKTTLMTMHAAKGLEFPVVFITGMEEGIFPHAKSFADPASLEEERRLCYVAITRAKEKLYLSRASRRMLFGEIQSNIPSRFLKEIPGECVEVKELNEDDDYEDDAFIIE